MVETITENIPVKENYDFENYDFIQANDSGLESLEDFEETEENEPPVEQAPLEPDTQESSEESESDDEDVIEERHFMDSL